MCALEFAEMKIKQGSVLGGLCRDPLCKVTALGYRPRAKWRVAIVGHVIPVKLGGTLIVCDKCKARMEQEWAEAKADTKIHHGRPVREAVPV